MKPEKDPKVVDLSSIKRACKDCHVRVFCLPMGLRAGELEQFDRIVKHPPTLSPDQYLYGMGTRFRSIYAVRTGSLKTFIGTADGGEQVVAFHLPGELVGLDAITGDVHACAAQALERTSVCEIPYDRLQAVSEAVPGLQRHLVRLMSKKILHDEQHLMLLGRKNADQRVATLIMSLGARLGSSEFAAREFRLSMSRTDIGNYLGLSIETVSRSFRRFRDLGFIEVERRRLLRIHQLSALRRLADGLSESEQGISLDGL